MKENLLKIINNYGVNKQLKKLSEEIFEFKEAVITYELKKSVEYEIPLSEIIGTHEHLEEEFADVCVLLEQFKAVYDLNNDRIIKIMKQKIDRQIKRMEK